MNSGSVTGQVLGHPPQELKALAYTPADLLFSRESGGPYASVSFTVGRSIGYGDIKVSATVTLACDQNEEALEETGKRAFLKATELFDDGMTIMLAKANIPEGG